MKKKCTVGADPEFFLKRKDNGKYVSAIPHIQGTKRKPQLLKSGGNVQRDNVALEFAIDPAVDGDDVVNKVRNAFKEIRGLIPEECDITADPSADFDEDQLAHEEAQRFGCDPDYCAWDIRVNDPPICDNPSLRTCGGHIHVGHQHGDGNEFLHDPMGKITLVRIMDAIHGIASVLLDSSEKAIERRKLYGKAGCHRPTEYGVEYRVLSNFWFKDPNLVMLMSWYLVQDALRIVREMNPEKIIDTSGKDRIRRTINEGLREEAEDILENNIKALLSEDSIHYLDICMKRNGKHKSISEEWGL